MLKLLTSMLLLVPLTQAAVILFSNFGPGDTATPTGGWGAGFTGINTSATIPALQFTVTGSNYAFTGAEFILRTLDDTSTAPVNISLVTDANGLPGNVIEQFVLNQQFSSSTTPSPTSVSSATNPLLLTGLSYWFTIERANDPNSAREAILWLSNNVGNQNRFANILPPSTTWTVQTGHPPPALRVMGDPVSTVPEPSTFLLIPAALGLLLRKRIAQDVLTYRRFEKQQT